MAHEDSSFFPRTFTVFANTGVDDYNKPYFTTQEQVYNWIVSKRVGYIQGEQSFQRDENGYYIRVDSDQIDYYTLLTADTVAYINNQYSTGTPRYTVGHITLVDWRNPNCFYVYYDIDYYMSFCDLIEWENSISMIEREHVKQDWEGTTPLLGNCGVNEGFNFQATYRIDAQSWNMYAGTDFNYVVVCPYDLNGDPNFEDNTSLKRYNGLNFNIFTSKQAVSNYLTLLVKNKGADVNKIVGIYTLPQSSKFNQSEFTFTPPWTKETRWRNAKIWSGEFNTFRLYMPAGNKPIDFEPEYINPSYTTFTVSREIFSQGDTLLIAVTPETQRTHLVGDLRNHDMSIFVSQHPQGAWVGDNYGQWAGINALPQILSFIGNSASTIMGGYASVKTSDAAAYSALHPNAGGRKNEEAYDAAQARGNAAIVSAGNSILQDILSGYQTWMNAKQNGASAGGTGNLGVNQMFEKYGYTVFMYFYQAPTNDLLAMDAYFDRFGYKVNALRAINPLNRPKWYFCKTAEAHIAGSLPYNARIAIEQMFNAGVTIWHTPTTEIGDFSNPESNRGTG